MRKSLADNLAKLSKPDAKELDTRNRESGLQGVVQIYSEPLDTDTVPSGAAWIEPADGVPQVMAKGQDGTTYQLPFGGGLPIGGTIVWPGASDPVGGDWLICDGRTLSTSVYADLFAVCGTTWNTGGEAAGTFRIPDMRSRVPVGAGQGTGLSNRVLGSTFGAENHTLGVTEIPAHSHTASGGSHSHTASGGSHSHGFTGTSHSHSGTFITSVTPIYNAVQSGSGANRMDDVSLGFGSTGSATAGGTVGAAGATPTISSTDATPAISNTGGGSSHNNMQPSLSINFVIRAL